MKNINISDKWKKVVSAVVFLVITYVVLYVVGFVMTPKNPLDRASYRTTDIRGITVEEANTLDVVNIGHSGVMYGIIPMEMYEKYGIASYNLAETSQSPREAYDIYCQVLESKTTSENSKALAKEKLQEQAEKIILRRNYAVAMTYFKAIGNGAKVAECLRNIKMLREAYEARKRQQAGK